MPPIGSIHDAMLRGLAFSLVSFLCVAGALFGCDRGSGGDEYVARQASFGKWADKRPSGSIIMHDMLVLDEPMPMLDKNAVLGAYVVTTSGPISGKIEDIVNDRMPVNKGFQLNFAFPEQLTVRIEIIREGGARELVAEKRVSFLEVIR
jgi:hypothetical protein